VKKYNRYLRDLIRAGRARPSFVVSHEVPLDQAPLAYDKFDKRIEGYTKVVLKPQGATIKTMTAQASQMQNPQMQGQQRQGAPRS
jgi:hypothetical protein